ncbi:hypothetical protein TanjilG_02859 [Lupinus angustifolius]|uniref:Uncharacterized protein n=1 Tax=Lupinus angustifolius TaxID=3871 RepID=A0A4P1RLS3_LUPAN|nr:hypothetical protein TanjilG_02859 [Lupinus angustifolius]
MAKESENEVVEDSLNSEQDEVVEDSINSTQDEVFEDYLNSTQDEMVEDTKEGKLENVEDSKEAAQGFDLNIALANIEY